MTSHLTDDYYVGRNSERVHDTLPVAGGEQVGSRRSVGNAQGSTSDLVSLQNSRGKD